MRGEADRFPTACAAPSKAADLDDYVSYRNEPDSMVSQGLTALDPGAARSFLIAQSEMEDDAFGWRMFIVELIGCPKIVLGEDGVYISEDDGQSGELGWWLGSSHRGRGYAVEATNALIGCCFANGGVGRVTARCLAANEASQKVMRKTGMRLETRSAESRNLSGIWRDEVGYAISKKEWAVPGAPNAIERRSRNLTP